MIAAGSTIIPSLRHLDAAAAIDWLSEALGFERHAIYADGAIVHHAEPTSGSRGLLGRARRPARRDRRARNQAGSVVSADAHYARAKAAGTRIDVERADQAYGGSAYTCRDLEGRIQWFGTYNPWTAKHG